MIKIEVTQEDIDKATEKLIANIRALKAPDTYISSWCPIALAGQRALNDPTFKWGYGEGYTGEYEGSNLVLYKAIDEDCQRSFDFVKNFDNGRKVKPITIHIVPKTTQDQGTPT